MGRYRSSDSEDDYSKKSKKKNKKRRGRSRSRSDSDSDSSRYSSSRHSRKSKRKHRKSSRSPDRGRGHASRSRRSRSRSLSSGRHSSRRDRSRDRTSSRRSRSKSPSRRRRSRSRSRDRRSYSRGRRSGSESRSSRRSRSRSSGRSKRSPADRGRDSTATCSLANMGIKGLSLAEQGSAVNAMTPGELTDQRMRLALKAAAAADQKLKAQMKEAGGLSSALPTQSILESQNFASSVAEIESDSFTPASFSSSRSTKIHEEPTEMRLGHDEAIFGSLASTGFTIKPDPDTKPLSLDPDSVIHPCLFTDPEERWDRWMDRLSQLRKRKLEGEAM